MKVCLAGHGSVRHQASRGHGQDSGHRGDFAGGFERGVRPRSGAAVEDTPLDREFGRESGAARPRCRDLEHADANARRAGRAMHARRQARHDRNSHGRLARRFGAFGARAAGNRRHRHGRAYAPLQSQPPMDPQAQSWPANSRFCRWTCRPISSAAPTPMRSASRAVGPIICCGITPATPWILFAYQTGENASRTFALEGPKHPTLGIAMDMSIGLKVASGAICTLSLSFNNEGPLGTFFRYICDNGTYIARYDELLNGKNESIDVSKVDVSMNGIELQDREFFAAIREEREPNASVAQCLPAMQTLDRLEKQLLRSRLSRPADGRDSRTAARHSSRQDWSSAAARSRSSSRVPPIAAGGRRDRPRTCA